MNAFSVSLVTVTPGTHDTNSCAKYAEHFTPTSSLQHLCMRTSHFLHRNKMLPVNIINLLSLYKECANVNYISTNILCRRKGCFGAVTDASVTTPCAMISPHVRWPGSHHNSGCPHFKNPLTEHSSEAGHLLYWLHWKSDLLRCTACQFLTSRYWKSGIDWSPVPPNSGVMYG